MHRSPADRERRDALHDLPGNTPPETDGQADPCLAHLEALGLAIATATDLEVSLARLPVSSAVALHVASPHPGRLNEDITCLRCDDAWWFVWSWGKPLGLANDLDAAVSAIRHVLSPEPGR
ncbi:MAG: hypothetical protein ACRDOO_04955 [Actinomadura sp.]